MNTLSKWAVWLGVFAAALGLLLAATISDPSMWVRRIVVIQVTGGFALAVIGGIVQIIIGLAEAESGR